jgi:DNA-binding FadR family transcriptional regulator
MTEDFRERHAAHRITMTDVAREAGCSQTTVSVVLGGETSIRISPETRRRVIEAVAALGYRHRPPRPGRPRPPPDAPAELLASSPALARAAGSARSRTARVTSEIGLRIVGGLYAEGATLPGDAELMGMFKVSRTVLREAMKTLSGKGLLMAKSRIGTRVRPRGDWQLFDSDVLMWHAEIGFTDEFLNALGEMRQMVEPEAAALAAARRQPGQIAALHAWVDRMAAGRSRRDFVDADLNLHIAIARLAGNPFLPALSSLIEVALAAALTKSSPVDEPGGAANSAAQHRAIVTAIAAGDAPAARAAMRVVIGEGVRRAATPAG